MGTNYFVVPNRPSIERPIHIGKSLGWMFLFQDIDDSFRDVPVVWHTYEEVVKWLYRYTVESKQYVIINEYDEIISFDDFFEMVHKQERFKDNPNGFTYCNNVNGYIFEEQEFR